MKRKHRINFATSRCWTYSFSQSQNWNNWDGEKYLIVGLYLVVILVVFLILDQFLFCGDGIFGCPGYLKK